MKGYVQVYTGNGKGKTTAALGLAIRAAGAGLQVFFAQFMKGIRSGEADAIEKLSGHITMKRYGSGSFIIGAPREEDIRESRKGLEEVKEAMISGRYQVVVLDEANVAIQYKLLSKEDIMDVIHLKPDNVELVITGRDADPEIIEAADLVTEMKEIKHYYQKGVSARTGIEK
jgi:cob(I)alamin adenosyltransferase